MTGQRSGAGTSSLDRLRDVLVNGSGPTRTVTALDLFRAVLVAERVGEIPECVFATDDCHCPSCEVARAYQELVVPV